MRDEDILTIRLMFVTNLVWLKDFYILCFFESFLDFSSGYNVFVVNQLAKDNPISCTECPTKSLPYFVAAVKLLFKILF